MIVSVKNASTRQRRRIKDVMIDLGGWILLLSPYGVEIVVWMRGTERCGAVVFRAAEKTRGWREPDRVRAT